MVAMMKKMINFKSKMVCVVRERSGRSSDELVQHDVWFKED